MTDGVPVTVSVVIPTYNYARFLGEAIRSALDQTVTGHEVIVVDDGSTDDTAEVVRSFGERVRYVCQANAGPSAARNTGIAAARAPYIVFLDSDDRLRPRALECGLSLLASHPECALVAGRHEYIDGQGAPLSGMTAPRRVHADHYFELLQSNFIGCPAAVMYRRQALVEVGGFNPALRQSEDYDVYLRIARRFPVLCHDEIIADYRKHGANTSQNLDKMKRGVCDVLRAQLALVAGQPRYEAACRRGIAFYERMFDSEQLVDRVRTHARARRWSQAMRDALGLLQRYPEVLALHAGRRVRRALRGAGRAAS